MAHYCSKTCGLCPTVPVIKVHGGCLPEPSYGDAGQHGRLRGEPEYRWNLSTRGAYDIGSYDTQEGTPYYTQSIADNDWQRKPAYTNNTMKTCVEERCLDMYEQTGWQGCFDEQFKAGGANPFGPCPKIGKLYDGILQEFMHGLWPTVTSVRFNGGGLRTTLQDAKRACAQRADCYGVYENCAYRGYADTQSTQSCMRQLQNQSVLDAINASYMLPGQRISYGAARACRPDYRARRFQLCHERSRFSHALGDPHLEVNGSRAVPLRRRACEFHVKPGALPGPSAAQRGPTTRPTAAPSSAKPTAAPTGGSGCTDSLASNYNKSATVDAGTCSYDGDGCGKAPEHLRLARVDGGPQLPYSCLPLDDLPPSYKRHGGFLGSDPSHLNSTRGFANATRARPAPSPSAYFVPVSPHVMLIELSRPLFRTRITTMSCSCSLDTSTRAGLHGPVRHEAVRFLARPAPYRLLLISYQDDHTVLLCLSG